MTQGRRKGGLFFQKHETARGRPETHKFQLGALLAGIISIFFGIVVIVWPALAYAIGILLTLFGMIAVVAALR